MTLVIRDKYLAERLSRSPGIVVWSELLEVKDGEIQLKLSVEETVKRLIEELLNLEDLVEELGQTLEEYHEEELFYEEDP